MTKPDGIPNDDVSWGTWEELLLAFAVNRHGDGAWDSIASELQKRTSDPNFTVTAKTCRLKYLDLKRRFVVEDKSETAAEEAAPLLEELRKLRVAELRREVQRYDLNIESLEMKMKSMEEERENRTDLVKNSEEVKKPEEEVVEPEKDQVSVNESNSTDLEPEKDKTKEMEKPEEDDRTGENSEEPEEMRSEPDRKSVRSDSCNGSSNSIEEKEEKEPKAEPKDLVESEDESDGGDAMKENSDVQSSASRSRKEEEEDKVRRGCTTSGDEIEHEDQSPAVKRGSVKSSQPLFDFLQTIKSHKVGSVFERRLRSQESSKYQKTIRQHLDLETIETRLKEGWYSNSTTKFFRDLLLLVTNALVFFAKNSSEANAAAEIRRLILKEMSPKQAKSNSSSGKQISLKSLSLSKKDEEEEEDPEPLQSLILKPRIPGGSLIACRKRSSIAAKADKKKEQVEEKETKPVEEPKITKKRTRDRFPSTSANSKKDVKKAAPVVEPPLKTTGKSGGSSEQKNENKKNQSSTLDSKKRGAANFLNRMKQGGSSSSNNGVLLDALKNTPLTSESSSGKGGGSKNESGKKKETSNPNNNSNTNNKSNTRRSAETRQSKEKEKEKGSPGKRNVGRPPKRGASAPTPPPPTLGKRGRGETETPPSKQQPKKRTRKL